MVKSLASEVAQSTTSHFVRLLLNIQATLAKMEVIEARATTNLKPTTFVLPSIILKLKPKNVSSEPC